MQQRNSNIEILRIICMAMVLMVHFVGGAFGLPSIKEMQSPTTIMLLKIFLESFAIIGVNCFILISGYFGIKFTIKGLIKFSAICLFASLFVFFARTTIEGYFNTKLFFESFLIYSHTDLWFVPAYLALYIISPLINTSLNSLNNKKILMVLLCLTFINVYLGWYHSDSINPYGYNVMQLIYIYVIGHYLFRIQKDTINLSSTKWLILYFGFTTLIAVSSFYLNSRQVFAYNSPFVLASSISFFMIFASKKQYTNQTINKVAAASFMVYLLHKSPYFWLKLKNTLINYATEFDGIIFVIICILLFFAIYILSTIIGILYNKIEKEAEHLFSLYSRQ